MKKISIEIENLQGFKEKVLHWLNHYDTFCFFDNNEYTHNKYSRYELLVAAGCRKVFQPEPNAVFDSLEKFLKNNKDYTFGYFGYDLKNQIEKLHSENTDRLKFPEVFFFQPEHIISIKPESGMAEIFSWKNNPENIFQNINHCNGDFSTKKNVAVQIQKRFAKETYLNCVEKIKQHIANGDFYEMNLCMEFFAEDADIEPQRIFEKLNALNRSPFSAFFRNKEQYLMCSSPERFLMKQGDKLLSQPIKGTIARDKNSSKDEWKKQQLKTDSKELAENVMIVDLVRNDLAKSCVAGSVKAEELFGIYTFPQVHQMISTVSGSLRKNVATVEAIKNAFPMGSMTGAPKVIVMEHIEKYEPSKRGLYSGAIGYFTPELDFDFNVVIRSILYNAKEKYLSFQTGSAITYDSVAEKEYEECLLKAQAMQQALG